MLIYSRFLTKTGNEKNAKFSAQKGSKQAAKLTD